MQKTTEYVIKIGNGFLGDNNTLTAGEPKIFIGDISPAYVTIREYEKIIRTDPPKAMTVEIIRHYGLDSQKVVDKVLINN